MRAAKDCQTCARTLASPETSLLPLLAFCSSRPTRPRCYGWGASTKGNHVKPANAAGIGQPHDRRHVISMNSAATIWEAALGALQLEVSKSNFQTWFKDTVGIACDGDLFLISAPNAFVAEYLEKSQRSLIEKTLIRLTQRNVNVRFQISWNSSSASMQNQASEPNNIAALYGFNSKYTFDNFVVGPGNRMAHAAALSAASKPAEHSYNPLFIYADPGLGKTHLLQAIGHQALENNVKPLYVSGEQFTHDFIEAIRERRTEEFRSKYRSADMLMVDDIQFISGKEQTEECFFHTFNDLHNAGRQIVITSDRQPKSMAKMEDRLKSRFEWGLMVDIQPPDYETRLAILRTKAAQAKTDITTDVLEMLAHEVRQNIRELEGSLNRILAYARLLRAQITPELAQKALKDVGAKALPPAGGNYAPDFIVSMVADNFALKPDDLTGRKRDRETAQARQVAMYILKQQGRYTLGDIGSTLGGRNASTVSHACEKIARDIAASHLLRKKVEDLQQNLLGKD
jgi:chromosomal replication initiator protein